MSRFRAAIERLLAPGWSYCYACRRPWKCVDEHITKYTPFSGMFPLCEGCWAERTVEQRLPFYRHLWHSWPEGRSNRGTWDDVEAAVRSGL